MSLPKFGTTATVTLILSGIILAATAAGLLTTTQTVPSTGTITAINLGVYSDQACTVPLSSLNWGSLSPGASTTQTIYIKNTGNVAETLTLSTTNWNPANAPTYLTVNWNRQGANLNPAATTPATLTLTATTAASALSTFNVNIVITGTQQ
jgi:hypothetical protein